MEKQNNNFFITILILLCTSLIILTNYISLKNSWEKIFNNIMQAEYNKIWWKDNYQLLKELQKKEVLSYLETLKNEKPDLIAEIQNKIKAEEKNYLFLDKESIKNLKNNSYIDWNTWALISLIEFSDFECEYCINYHNSNILKDILKENENINYIFKNFNLPKNKNSKIIANSTECIKEQNNWTWYLNYIDEIFKSSLLKWDSFSLDKLSSISKNLWIDEVVFTECISTNKYNKNIENDFQLWLSLWINSVPTTIILNNNTWEYVLLNEAKEKKYIENIILNFNN